MSRRALAAAIVSVLFTFTGACTDSPATPTVFNATMTVQGTWKTDVSVNGQAATMTWVLSQTGNTASGPVTITLPSGTVLLNGSLTGTVSNGTATTATLTFAVTVAAGGVPTQPSCTGQFGGTMAAVAGLATTMTGDFSLRSSTCTAPFTSTSLTLTKQ